MHAAAMTALEQTLHHEIPLSRAMQVRVEHYDGRRLILRAPLGANINHKSTAFGGSLYSLAVLCGWGLLHMKLREAQLHATIVIQESSIRYLHPVSTDFAAVCQIPEDFDMARLLSTLRRRGRARAHLETFIRGTDEVAVEFSGSYVLHA